jgi:translation initiation factor 4E
MAAEGNGEFHPLQHEWVLWERQGGGGSTQQSNPNDWKDQMKEICSFSTVEDFWRYYNHMPKPSEIFFDGDTKKRVQVGGEGNGNGGGGGGGGGKTKTVIEYNLFKRGIVPEWADPQNATGGSFFIRQSLEMHVLDMFWQNLVMGLVGESLEDKTDADINGYANGNGSGSGNGTSNGNNNSNAKRGLDCICGARVVDKGRNMPIFRVELWINTRDAEIKDRMKSNLVECLMDGLPTSALRKGPPKFDWKDHD